MDAPPPSSLSRPTPALVRLARVRCVFDGGRTVALDGIDLAVAEGECLAILGRSGSGKSCLLNVMTGLAAPTSGEVLWRGAPVGSTREWAAIRHREVGIVFQEFNLMPTLTALENVEIALLGRGIGAAERRRRADAALARVGLDARADHLPSALSGGERQRVAIARSVVTQPRLLVADEPTGNLDSVTGQAIAGLLFDLHAASGTTLVIVTHDPALAAGCPRRIRLHDGRIVEDTAAGPAMSAAS